jgi:hypothetical protein
MVAVGAPAVVRPDAAALLLVTDRPTLGKILFIPGVTSADGSVEEDPAMDAQGVS